MLDRRKFLAKGAKANEIKFAYHNHGYGLSKMEGQIPLNIIFKNTDPKLVFFEMDLYWTTAGDGVLDLKNIISTAKVNGVKHFIIEQDIVKSPEIALKRSHDYLASLTK